MVKIKDMKIVMIMFFILGTLLLAACANTSSTSLPSNSTDSTVRTLHVTGIGSVNGTPDIARIDLGVETTDPDAAVAVEETNRKMSEVLNALEAFGIAKEDLRTTQYNLRQQNEIDPQTGRSTGKIDYIVSNTVEVTVRNIDQIGGVIDTGFNNGANQISGLTLDIEDRTPLATEARTKAIQDATNRAQEIADDLGIELLNPIEISESLGSTSAITAEQAAIGLGGGAAISTGQLSVTIQVDVTFAIE
jgi:uncharacterized protein YggE